MGCSETKSSQLSSLMYLIWNAVFRAITEIDSKTPRIFYLHIADESETPVDVQAFVHWRRMSTGEV